MIPAFTVAQIRDAEAVALQQDSNGALMRRAAGELAGVVIDLLLDRLGSPLPGRRVVLLVGSGNNGGDALFAGARLRRRGLAVTAVLAADRAHPAGLAALQRAGGRVVRVDPRKSVRASISDGAPSSPDDQIGSAIDRADLVVDGLFGIGARLPLPVDIAGLVEVANGATALRVAVDVPTGLAPDSGVAQGVVFRADLTVTFGGMKAGLLIGDGHAGRVTVAGLGFEPTAEVASVFSLTDLDVEALLPAPGSADDKFSAGLPGVVAGSLGYPGAAVLCVGAAVRTRPGMVRYAGPQATAVLARWPEVVAGDDPATAGQVQAWVAGPGMGTDAVSLALLHPVLDFDGPVLIDADGLTMLADRPSLLAARLGKPTVLTPHAREFARIFPAIDLTDRLAAVRRAAAESGATVLLKGHRTLIAEPHGRVFVNTTGSPWLATAGSGDVLSGIIGSLLAAGLEPVVAAAVGAHLHGRAGERAAADRAAGAQQLWDRIRVPAR